jgi:maltose alpha-D-glucosyltransferase/alpha-amylase
MKNEEIVRNQFRQILDDISKERWFPLKGESVENMGLVRVYPKESTEDKTFIIQIMSINSNKIINLLVDQAGEEVVGDSIKSGEIVEFIKNILNNKYSSDITFEGDREKLLNSMETYKPINGNQSNSSFILGGKIIGKFLRTATDQRNPDYIVPRTLWDQTEFRNIPEPIGKIMFLGKTCLCTFAEYVPNNGDYWAYLQQNSAVNEQVNEIYDSAKILGKITANLHISLSSISNVDFNVEPFFTTDIERMKDSYENYTSEVESILKRVKNNNKSAEYVLEKIDILRKECLEFNRLKHEKVMKQRIHGDYHLGQILHTVNGPIIIDFEGEPVRSMDERIMRQCTMKDLAGLIRSFDYFVRTKFEKGDSRGITISNMVKDSYFSELKKSGTDNETEGILRKVLDVYTLEKAMYEVIYEYENRPDWIDIPLSFLSDFLKSK